jgi:NAD(P)-dependent dehydrogenase (short-subunit alcohol dehydrogenase family)
MGRLDGTTAIVTGASPARLLGAEGARVLLTDIHADIGGALAAEGGALSMIPLRRIARPKEFSNLVLLLTSNESSYIRGAGITAQ